MPFETTPIRDLLLYTPRIFGDERGYFFESWNERTFSEAGIDTHYVQGNQVLSKRAVLRGMHMQTGEHAQGKLLRVLVGEVFDVAVDMRPDSPTLNQWFGTHLSDENHRQMLIPRGFAHGYLVLSETALVAYKCDNFYAPQAELGLRYDDPAVGIEWPEVDAELVVAERDLNWDLL